MRRNIFDIKRQFVKEGQLGRREPENQAEKKSQKEKKNQEVWRRRKS